MPCQPRPKASPSLQPKLNNARGEIEGCGGAETRGTGDRGSCERGWRAWILAEASEQVHRFAQKRLDTLWHGAGHSERNHKKMRTCYTGQLTTNHKQRRDTARARPGSCLAQSKPVGTVRKKQTERCTSSPENAQNSSKLRLQRVEEIKIVNDAPSEVDEDRTFVYVYNSCNYCTRDTRRTGCSLACALRLRGRRRACSCSRSERRPRASRQAQTPPVAP